jgi:hypothetical protein
LGTGFERSNIFRIICFSRSTQNHLSRITDLASNDIPSNAGRFCEINMDKVLCAPKQHIPRHRTLNPCPKTAGRTQKHQGTSIFSTAMDERRTDQNVAKAHYAAQVVERDLELCRSIYFHLQRFMIQAEVGPLGHDEQGV